MKIQPATKKGKMFIAVDSRDNYDMTDCLDILRNLQTPDRQDKRKAGLWCSKQISNWS
jgi:hypothetical protein